MLSDEKTLSPIIPEDPVVPAQSMPYHIEENDLILICASNHIYMKGYRSGVSIKKLKEATELVNGVMQAKMVNGRPSLYTQKDVWITADAIEHTITELRNHLGKHPPQKP